MSDGDDGIHLPPSSLMSPYSPRVFCTQPLLHSLSPNLYQIDDTQEYDLQIIETGDSVKVKQVFDEAIVEAITDAGFQPNFYWETIKLVLMFISCVFAMVAQFFPIPFPDSRPLLGLCCASYFILSVVLQYIISYVDKDTIMITNPVPVNNISSDRHYVMI